MLAVPEAFAATEDLVQHVPVVVVHKPDPTSRARYPAHAPEA
jgi:hypothetical protein